MADEIVSTFPTATPLSTDLVPIEHQSGGTGPYTSSVATVAALVAAGGGGGSGAFGSSTDVDFTTEGLGKFLTAVASSGKPFSFQTPSGGGGSTTLTSVSPLVPRQSQFQNPISVSSATYSFPNTAGVGNLLVFYGYLSGGTVSAPTGWTQVGNSNGLMMFYRTASGTTADNFVLSASSNVTGTIVLQEFVAGSTPYGFTVTNTGAYDYETPLLTTTGPSLVIVFYNGNQAEPIAPAGWTISSLGGGDFGSGRMLAIAWTVVQGGQTVSLNFQSDDGSTRYVAQFAIPITGASIAATSYDAVILSESSLTQYWPLSDTVGTTSPANLKGTGVLSVPAGSYFGAAPMASDGETSVMTDGSGAGISGANSSIPNLSTGPWTMEFIADFVGYSGSQATIFNADGSNNGPYLYANESSQSNTYALYNGSSTFGNGTTFGRPAHFAFVVSASKVVSVYINGVLYASDSVNPGSGTFYLGCNAGSSGVFRSRISKVAIYNSALSVSRIAAHVAAMGYGAPVLSTANPTSVEAANSWYYIANSPGSLNIPFAIAGQRLVVCVMAASLGTTPSGWTNTHTYGTNIAIYEKLAAGTDTLNLSGFGALCAFIEAFDNAATGVVAFVGNNGGTLATIATPSGVSEVRAGFDNIGNGAVGGPPWTWINGNIVGGRASLMCCKRFTGAHASVEQIPINGSIGNNVIYAVQ